MSPDLAIGDRDDFVQYTVFCVEKAKQPRSFAKHTRYFIKHMSA